jgi:alanine dehydrogenase
MVLVLTESDVAQVINMADGLRLVEDAFRHYSEGKTIVLPRVSVDLPGGGGAFRVMSACLPGMGAFGLKTLTGYPGRRTPGEAYFAVLLFNGESGALRAILAGKHLTGIRTGAATGVAAKYLAREDAATLGVFGAGAQARDQVAALASVRRLRRIKIFDIDRPRAADFARAMAEEFQVESSEVATAREAVAGSDLVVTVTTAREPVFCGDWLEKGTHVSGVGSNSPAKKELDGVTFSRSKLVLDFREQVLQEAGDLQQAMRSGAIDLDHIHAELGDIVTGKKEGRSSPEEITLFKSVGVAVEDIATAAFVYQQALARGLGKEIALGA